MTGLPTRTFKPRRYRPDDTGDIGNIGKPVTWSGHLPFVNDLIAAIRPSLLVELGTCYGESYFGMCQAVQENAVSCLCYGVDTWKGDQHSGLYDESVFDEVNRYNEDNYASFSRLLRTTFDAALQNFGDGTVDLLHIDGLPTYDAVRHDFDSWFPRVRPGGVVLVHGTAARQAGHQVWKLWEELARQFPHIEFTHGWGLGVVRKPGVSASDTELVQAMFSASPAEQDFLRHYYGLQAELLERRYLAAHPSSLPQMLVAERDAALTRSRELGAEVRNLQAERVAVVADYRRVHALNEMLENEVASLKNRLVSEQARGLEERVTLEAELKIVHGSRSWRLTAPLRGLFRAMRR